MRCFLMALFLVTAIPASTDAASGTVRVNLVIKNSGTVFWDGVRLNSDADLVEMARPYAASGQRLSVHVSVERKASYDAVARTLALLQRNCRCATVVDAQR
jgi:biopolymer transport protein ExbD